MLLVNIQKCISMAQKIRQILYLEMQQTIQE